MNYTLHQLQVFLIVTKTLSITRAAEELFLTQPAVSIQLKNFQNQFEIPLTEVIKKRLYVTDFGKEIALAAENILNEVYAINYKTLAFKGKLSGRLKLSVVSTGKYVIPYYLSNFLKNYNEIELEMDVNNKKNVVKALKNNEVDFAFVSVLPKELDIESEILLENNLYLVGDAAVYNKTNTDFLSLFSSSPLISRELGSATRTAMEDYIAQQNIQPKTRITLTSNEAVKQAVIAGIGISIMPIIGLKNELDNGSLFLLPANGLPIVTSWRLIWLKGKKMSPVASAFLDYIKSNKNEIKESHFSWIKNY
ncbi:DNA-binding transcriptional regulator, LysR family [Flavobacterium segetis]|uniref:DNA-binding transcriptional regulator, LysR family n=1 Tax=Flavobacterium segetis TaxID=271157 RepID=A0A1M5E0R9_9FLAO|nr:LysR family transcriptional regulator [Flavobacterium segetis]SHF72651.1 DNA-binding transcriptional regulator, LysR family [Flavobacterium segetis]